MNECIYLFISSFLHYFMNIKHPCKKVELLARFVVVITKLVPDSPYRRLIAEYLSFQTAVPRTNSSIAEQIRRSPNKFVDREQIRPSPQRWRYRGGDIESSLFNEKTTKERFVYQVTLLLMTTTCHNIDSARRFKLLSRSL